MILLYNDLPDGFPAGMRRFNITAAGLAGAVALTGSGCIKERSIFDHEIALTARTPTTFPRNSVKGIVQPNDDLANWAAEYFALEKQPGSAARNRQRECRNHILRRLVLLDDEYFLAWCTHLYGGQATATTAGEIINTALTGAASVITPGTATQVLAGVASGLSAARTSIDKNYFFQQNVPTLVSKMEQLRADIKTQLHQYFAKPVADYTLDDGLQDFVRYYKAGTLTAAAEALNLEVNKDRQAAQDKLEATKGDNQVAAPRLKASTQAAAVEAQAKRAAVPDRVSPSNGSE